MLYPNLSFTCDGTFDALFWTVLAFYHAQALTVGIAPTQIAHYCSLAKSQISLTLDASQRKGTCLYALMNLHDVGF